jgi:hypothetical protein
MCVLHVLRLRGCPHGGACDSTHTLQLHTGTTTVGGTKQETTTSDTIARAVGFVAEGLGAVCFAAANACFLFHSSSCCC